MCPCLGTVQGAEIFFGRICGSNVLLEVDVPSAGRSSSDVATAPVP